jgi:hypothetical protein
MSSSDLHIYGGFNLSPYLAMRVFEVVGEIAAQSVDISLSHVDDDECEICRKAAVAAQAPKEDVHHAAGTDFPRGEWAA